MRDLDVISAILLLFLLFNRNAVFVSTECMFGSLFTFCIINFQFITFGFYLNSNMGCMNRDMELFCREISSNRASWLVVRQVDNENVLNRHDLRHTRYLNDRKRKKSPLSRVACKRSRTGAVETHAHGVDQTNTFQHNEEDFKQFAESLRQTIEQRREENRIVYSVAQEMDIDQRW